MIQSNDQCPAQADAVPDQQPARPRRDVTVDILNAFHFACDIKDLDIAQRLLATLETLINDRSDAAGFDRPRALATIVAAYERLWALRHN